MERYRQERARSDHLTTQQRWSRNYFNELEERKRIARERGREFVKIAFDQILVSWQILQKVDRLARELTATTHMVRPDTDPDLEGNIRISFNERQVEVRPLSFGWFGLRKAYEDASDNIMIRFGILHEKLSVRVQDQHVWTLEEFDTELFTVAPFHPIISMTGRHSPPTPPDNDFSNTGS